MSGDRTCRKCSTLFSLRTCPICTKRRYADWIVKNAERKRGADKANKLENSERHKALMKHWKSSNPEKWRAIRKKCASKLCSSTSDRYLTMLLRAKIGTVSSCILEMKRCQIEIFRLSTQLKNQLRNKNEKGTND